MCGEPPDPTSACWDQLLPCGCNNPAESIYVSSTLFDSLPEGHTVVSLGGNCWRRAARFSGIVPENVRYSQGVHGPVGDSFPSCAEATCTIIGCADDCAPPNETLSATICDPSSPTGTAGQTWCASGGYIIHSREARLVEGSYTAFRSGGDVVRERDSDIVETISTSLVGEFRFDGFGQTVWVSVTASSAYKRERIARIGIEDEVFVDRFASFTGANVSPSELSSAMQDGFNLFPPVGLPTDAMPSLEYFSLSSQDSGCPDSGLVPRTPVGICAPNALSSTSCDLGAGVPNVAETYSNSAGGNIGELGNFRFFYDDDWSRVVSPIGPDDNLTRRTSTARNAVSTTYVWYPPDTGIVVDGDCTTSSDEGGDDAQPLTNPPGGIGSVPGFNPQQAQIDAFGCSGCGG